MLAISWTPFRGEAPVGACSPRSTRRRAALTAAAICGRLGACGQRARQQRQRRWPAPCRPLLRDVAWPSPVFLQYADDLGASAALEGWSGRRPLTASPGIGRGTWTRSGRRRGGPAHTVRMAQDDLPRIARLLEARNEIDDQIAAVIKRPMTSGHLGEWIASQVFDIELEASASAAGIDGRFRSGPLRGRTVNVKWYLKREGMLDMTRSEVLDEYLVMTGPVSAAASSHGRTRPWRIDSVYLFDARIVLA